MILVIGASSGLANVVVNSLSQFDDVILTHYRNPLGNNSQFLDLTDNESIDNFISINKTRLKKSYSCKFFCLQSKRRNLIPLWNGKVRKVF